MLLFPSRFALLGFFGGSTPRRFRPATPRCREVWSLHQSWIARAQRFISLGRHAVVCWRRRCSYFFAFTKLGCRRASSAKVGHERVRRRFSGTVTPMSFRIMSVFITMSTNIICTQQSDYRLAFCRKRWRRRLNDDDDDDDGDYVDGMLMMVVMVTVMLIMLMDPTRKSITMLAQVV